MLVPCVADRRMSQSPRHALEKLQSGRLRGSLLSSSCWGRKRRDFEAPSSSPACKRWCMRISAKLDDERFVADSVLPPLSLWLRRSRCFPRAKHPRPAPTRTHLFDVVPSESEWQTLTGHFAHCPVSRAREARKRPFRGPDIPVDAGQRGPRINKAEACGAGQSARSRSVGD